MHASLSECSTIQDRFQALVSDYCEYTDLISAIYRLLLRLEALNTFYLFDTSILVYAMKTPRNAEWKSSLLRRAFRWVNQTMFADDSIYLTFEFLSIYCKHINSDATLLALLPEISSPKLDHITFLNNIEDFKSKHLVSSEEYDLRLDTAIFDNYNMIILVTKGLDDPTAFVESYTTSQGQKIKTLAMCAPSEISTLESIIHRFISEGFWILLKNVHLAPLWFKKFESQFPCSDKGPKVFVTWDSSMALDRRVLMRRYRLVYQSADTFQATLLQLYHFFGHLFENAGNIATHLMLKSLLVHAITVCRQRYIPFGWTKLHMFDNNDLLLSLTSTRNFIQACLPFQDTSYHNYQEFNSNSTLIGEWRKRVHNIYASKISGVIDNLIMKDILAFIDSEAFPLDRPCEKVLQWIHDIPRDAHTSIIGLPDSIEQLVLQTRVSNLREFTQYAALDDSNTKHASVWVADIDMSLFDDVEPLLATALTTQLVDSCRENDHKLVQAECRKVAQFTTNPAPVNLSVFSDPHKLLDMIRSFVACSTGMKADELELVATPIPETATFSRESCKIPVTCTCYITDAYLNVNCLELVGACYDFENCCLTLPKDSSVEVREPLSIHLQWVRHTCNAVRKTTILPIYNAKRYVDSV